MCRAGERATQPSCRISDGIRLNVVARSTAADLQQRIRLVMAEQEAFMIRSRKQQV